MNENSLIIPDCIFPTNNELEIPTLRSDMQPKFCDIPFVCFGEQKRTYDMQNSGTLHFYTDDYRFNSIYENPNKVLKQRPANIVEPNFSIFNEMPIAFALQNIYKKRWVARMMQEQGIRVFVDLNVAPKFYKLNLIGIPKGYASFCTRGYSDRLQYLQYEYEIAKYIAGENELLFVVYGGGRLCQEFCKEKGAIYVTPVVNIKKKLKSFEKIEDTIAFFGNEIKLDVKVPQIKQIEDYGES